MFYSFFSNGLPQPPVHNSQGVPFPQKPENLGMVPDSVTVALKLLERLPDQLSQNLELRTENSSQDTEQRMLQLKYSTAIS